MKRPILYWVILFILGEIFYKIFSVYMVGFLGIISVVFFVRNRRLGKKRVLQLVGVICFFLGVFCMHLQLRTIAQSDMENGTEIFFEGKVLKEESGNGISYIVHVEKWNEKNSAMKVQIYLNDETDLFLGSRVFGKGVIRNYSTARNPGGYDEKSYKHGQGIMTALHDVEFEKVDVPVFSLRESLDKLQGKLEQVYAVLFSEQNASLATAMVLGEKNNLDADIKALYQKNGIAHLIAISGLHVAMIGGSLYKLLRRLTGSYPIAGVVGAVFIYSYGLMTGLSGATFRAIVMLLISIGADVSGRRYDGLTAISLALFVMLIHNPYQITQAGFLLSFGAVLGIVIVQPIWRQGMKKLPKYLDGICVSISVQLVLTPIVLWFFYEMPIYGVVLNVIVVPLMNILLAMLILCGVMGMFSMELAVIPSYVADGIFVIYERLCQLTECLPGHTLCTGRPTWMWILVYYSLLACGVFFLLRNKKKCAYGSFGLLVALFGLFLIPSSLHICMFDVGQGDGIYIRTAEHKHILVDGGSSTEYNIGKYVLKNGLKYYGASAIDYVFITHSDSDHYSGIQEILEHSLIPIKNIVFPAITNPDEAYKELVQLAKQKGCSVYYMKKGDVLEIGNVQLQCLNPVKQSYEDKNAGSIVLQLTYDKFDMLLTGDLPQDEEQKLLGDLKENIEVLKVGHHGSATSTSFSFLQRLCPLVACISVGENNMYGHPAKEVMVRLSQFVQKIYLTKDSGAITIETNGKEYYVETFLQ